MSGKTSSWQNALAYRSLVCLVLSLSSLAATANEDRAADDNATPRVTMQQIEDAWRKGDFIFAREGLGQLAAEGGSAVAEYRYGRVLLEGRGGPRDIPAAIKWLEQAAGRNHVSAMTLLARLQLSDETDITEGGAGTAPELSENRAVDLLSRAAALGGADAQYLLGQLYLTGTGVEKDATSAYTWYLAAANQNMAEAQYTLSQLYDAGLGTAVDPATAVTWLRSAAENGHHPAQFRLAVRLKHGDGTDPAPDEALQWYRRAAETGMPIAQRELGMHYLRGDLVDQNVDEGLRWLQTAAEAGDAGAMSNLGFAYATGLGVTPNDQDAARWYALASERGLGRAMVALARFYETGRGVEQNSETALGLYMGALETSDAGAAALRLGQLAGAGALDGRMAPHRMVPWALAAAVERDAGATSWLERQAKDGLRPALTALAEIYLDDDVTGAQGVKLLEQAAMAGDPAAQLRLGQLYLQGKLVARDYVSAHKWFNIAATLGASEAARLRASVGDLMTPEQLAEAQTATRTWFATQEPGPPQTHQSISNPSPDSARE
ncbi:SEL1-like repeat protein [Roseovarius aestuariivivens]|uniref:SEL1-like repeat protein n=1 Tax=Roseovarius aestuariivivens TaxID=1888910 RepID=UPI001436AC15|nr:SEL1-like repeat protein [Roseovarius aestuariivivens]